MKWLEALFGLRMFIRRELGQNYRDWASWAASDPKAAAIQLNVWASDLEAAAAARRPRRSGRLPWLARRQNALATRLRAQAKDLYDYSSCTDLASLSEALKQEPTRVPGT